MKVLFSMVCALLILNAYPYSTETANGLTWKYTTDSSSSYLYGAGTSGSVQGTSTIPRETVGKVIIPSQLGGKPLRGINSYAFAYCSRISLVLIPNSVVHIDSFAFSGCSALEKIIVGRGVQFIGTHAFSCQRLYGDVTKLNTVVFKGGYIPYDKDNQYTYVTSSCDVSILVSTKWTLPCTWCDHKVKYYDPLPNLGTSPQDEEVAYVMDDFADAKAKAQISNEQTYNAYRNWASKVAGDDVVKRQSVVDSSFSWLSYALDLNTLLTKKPVQGDIHISDFRKDEAKDATGIVSIDNISVGVDATAANLAEVFGVEGSATVDGVYSADNVIVNAWSVENGKVLFSAKPKDGSLTAFFVRATMNP